MFDDRLEEFSRERLGGHPVPEDVWLLATAQWEGRGHPFEQFGITILEPGAQEEDGSCYGYWLHPQQRGDHQQPPPVIKVDTELTYEVLAGRTFSEACLYDISFDDDELFVEVAAELAQLHISIPVSSREDLDVLSAVPAPADLHRHLYYTERERLGLPD
ncbi:hypothetical protein ACWCQZ_50830 [Streptomyces sp. NPDC002285]